MDWRIWSQVQEHMHLAENKAVQQNQQEEKPITMNINAPLLLSKIWFNIEGSYNVT